MTEYFLVFNRHGLRIFETGKEPTYLNALILSLDPNRAKVLRNVQNHFVFVEAQFDLVFLGVYLEKNEEAFKNDIFAYLESQKSPTSAQQKKQDEEPLQIKTKNTRKINKSDKENEETSQLDFSVSQKSHDNNFELSPISSLKSRLSFNLFSKRVSKDVLRQKLENQLLSKNVGTEVTAKIVQNVLDRCPEQICEKECVSLLRKSISWLVHSARHSEIIESIRKSTSVFVFCFVGVNGVGKSTSLAKVCCWLLQNNLSVFIAACDTFRAGAIEQLKTHVAAFQTGGYDVSLYERGYCKDDAAVARSAIAEAQKKDYDVVLIDTAGRMHNNSQLMQSLSKLVRTAKIDHFIYVGEALVGNDSLDHLKQFNEAIKQGNSTKRIDSLFVTKVDTVDDKMGQILNMSVCADAPILFLGTGQTNMNVSKVDTDSIADSLLSS